MRRAGLVLLLAAGLALAACHRKPKPPPQPPAAAPPPMAFALKTPDASVKLTLGPRIAAHSGLRAKLYDDGVTELKAFAAQAANDRQHLAAKGIPIPPYERTIAWTITADTPTLLSAEESWFDYTGGAHPNHGAKGLIWNVVRDQEIARGDLFKPGADQERLDTVLCDAIKKAKAARQGAVIDYQTWPCPKWSDSNFVLAPSTQPDKLGGLTFLFDPYALGPYVEGGYAVTVPQAAFAWALSPDYAGAFAGAPKPAPATTGQDG